MCLLRCLSCEVIKAALTTCEGLLSGVTVLVYFQMSSFNARIVALTTHERLLSGVGPDVAFEMRSLGEGGSALDTTERFISGMNRHVAVEIASQCARVIALCAS